VFTKVPPVSIGHWSDPLKGPLQGSVGFGRQPVAFGFAQRDCARSTRMRFSPPRG